MPSDGTISKLTIPVKEGNTVTNKTYDLPSGGGDISGKADKVSEATSGNFAGLDSNGNLTDSGSKPSDFLTSHQDISGKMDKSNPTGTGSFSLNRKADTTVGSYSTAEGYNTTASGNYSHAEGNITTAIGIGAHAEGYNTTTSGNYSHAEGRQTTASSNYSHAEGYYTEASTNVCAHAEGFGYTSAYKVIASGIGAHAEGVATDIKGVLASGEGSHAEGGSTTAIGQFSHAEGYNTTASGSNSHAGGRDNTAGYDNQTVVGKYNSNKSTTLFEVGNGAGSSSKSNAFEVYSDGSLSGDNGTTKTKLPVIKTATLAANATSVTFTDMPSSGNNMIDLYTSVPGLNYTAISTSGTSVTLTYPAQSSSVTVYCSITEVTS